MNKIGHMLAMTALFLGLTLSLAAYEKAAEAMKAGQLKLQAKDFAGAARDADEAVALAGENVNEKINAIFFKGQVAEAAKEFAKAKEAYAIVAADAKANRPQIIAAYTKTANVLMTENKMDEARMEYAKIAALAGATPADLMNAGVAIGRSYERQSSIAKAQEEYAKAAAITGLDAKGKATALIALAKTYKIDYDLANMKKTMAAVDELLPAPDHSLLRDYALVAAAKGDAKEEAAAWERILALPAINDAQRAEALFKKIDLLAAERQYEEAGKLAAAAAADGKMTEEQKFLAALLAVGFKAGKDGAVDAKSIPAVALDAEKTVKLHNDAAKVFMRARNDEVARFFEKRAEGMYRKVAPPVYECLFMDKAPFGVAGWRSSDIVKDLSRREARFEEYNKKAAALLVNDVNVVREVGAGDAKKSNAGFYMAADARGWHVYVHCQDDQVEQVLAGLAQGGTLEMYFEPGEGECYYQWLLTLPSEKANCVAWMSPHRKYRKMDDFFKVEVAPVDDGFGVYLFFPWDLVYDKLPKEGDLWTFGLVNWSRNGGFTWGSGQVHELHKFGKVKFVGVDKQMPLVRRAIVLKAFANYQKAAAAATTFWNDEVKGDKDFYGTALLPRIEKFNELGKLVRPAMTQTEADMLFEKAAPDWMEFAYLISELRTEYLNNKLFADRK